ncbi:hypothetical protein KI387_029686, partial [Taxus chinensis]
MEVVEVEVTEEDTEAMVIELEEVTSPKEPVMHADPLIIIGVNDLIIESGY